MLIDIRCKHCRRLLGRVSSNFYGVIELRCTPCKLTQQFSLADLTRQSPAQQHSLADVSGLLENHPLRDEYLKKLDETE